MLQGLEWFLCSLDLMLNLCLAVSCKPHERPHSMGPWMPLRLNAF